jgi:hypothetical protein
MSVDTCGTCKCGKEIRQPIIGRTREYCLDACRKRASRNRILVAKILSAASRNAQD